MNRADMSVIPVSYTCFTAIIRDAPIQWFSSNLALSTWINEMALLTSFKINKMLEYLGTIYWWFVHKTFLEFYFNTCRLPNQPHILSRVYKKGFEKLRLNGRVVVNVEDFRVYDLCVKMKKKVWYISLEIIRIAHKKWTTKEQHSLAWYWWQYF